MVLTDAGVYPSVDIMRRNSFGFPFVPLLYVQRQYLRDCLCGAIVDNAPSAQHGHYHIQIFRDEKLAIKRDLATWTARQGHISTFGPPM